MAAALRWTYTDGRNPFLIHLLSWRESGGIVEAQPDPAVPDLLIVDGWCLPERPDSFGLLTCRMCHGHQGALSSPVRQANTWPVLPDLRDQGRLLHEGLTTDYCLPRSWWRQQAVLYQCWETWWRNSWCLFKKALKDSYGNGTKEDLRSARLSRFLLFWGLYRDSCCLNTKNNVIKPNRTVLIQSYFTLLNSVLMCNNCFTKNKTANVASPCFKAAQNLRAFWNCGIIKMCKLLFM